MDPFALYSIVPLYSWSDAICACRSVESDRVTDVSDAVLAWGDGVRTDRFALRACTDLGARVAMPHTDRESGIAGYLGALRTWRKRESIECRRADARTFGLIVARNARTLDSQQLRHQQLD